MHLEFRLAGIKAGVIGVRKHKETHDLNDGGARSSAILMHFQPNVETTGRDQQRETRKSVTCTERCEIVV